MLWELTSTHAMQIKFLAVEKNDLLRMILAELRPVYVRLQAKRSDLALDPVSLSIMTAVFKMLR